ncbi:MAG TPA: DUF6569 family protein [Pyrinomonadaceae bacterium]
MKSSFVSTRGWLALCLSVLMLAGAAAALPTGDGPPKKSGWQTQSVGRPISYKNLTLFPVYSRGATADADAYITLDEGIRAGTVIITERGGGDTAATLQRRPSGRGSAAVQQASMRSDNASVNELSLTNRSGRKLMLLAGEVIVGGKQDRIVQDDVVIPPVSVPISLSVFCVEHGRWSQRTSAEASGGGGGGAAPAPVIAPSGARKSENFYSLGAVAHPTLRAAAQDKKQQSEVWKEVGENNAKLGTGSGTDTYQQVYASKKVADSVESYVGALRGRLLGPGVVGVVVARNGEVVWADVFASPGLFARYWPKLLKSYAVEALAEQRSERSPTADEASRYLYDRAGTRQHSGSAGVFELVKIENPRHAIFELWDISLAEPLRLHFNKVRR